MSAKKQKSASSVSAELRQFGAWLLGPGRAAALWALLVAMFIVGPYLAYQWWLGPRLAAARQHRVGPRQVEITPPPEWVRCDLCVEVFRDPTLDGSPSILDDDLVERIGAAFSRHPWVAHVVRVSKHPPASVRVELEYRRPVCMVATPSGLWPVDAEGFLLPAGDNFSPVEAARYPRLAGVDQPPTVPPGQRWQDARVIGGAEIAAAIGAAWPTLQLLYIVPLAADPTVAASAGRAATEPFFALTTRTGSRILWGYAPGAKTPGELSPAEKIARLQRYANDHDTLDGVNGRPQELDVRAIKGP